MILRKIFLPMSAATLILTGCAHGLMMGSVAMKVSDDEAHVCMDTAHTKVGDRLELFKNICKSPKGGLRSGLGDVASCTKTQLGEGTVTKILNEHYSVVKFDSGVAFEEGTFVEKR